MLGRVSKITDNLYLGSHLAVTAGTIKQLDIKLIINATVEIPELELDNVEFIHIKLPDAPHSPLNSWFDMVANKINAVSMAGGNTLVHCVAGVSRSSSLCIAYLIKFKGMTLRSAYYHVKSCRPIIRPNVGFFKQLIEYEKTLLNATSVKFEQSSMGPVPDVYSAEVCNMIPLDRNKSSEQWSTTYNSSFNSK